MLRRRNFLKLAALAATAILPLSGWLSGPATAQATDTLEIAFSARGLRTIDPARSIQGADEWAIIHIHDKLVDVPKGRFPRTVAEVAPSLATDWQVSDDAKTWTFTLREGIKFQKGYGEMTSQDVKFTFDRLLNPEELGVNRALYHNIESVEVDGPYKVVFQLKQPDPLFPLGPLLHYSASIISQKAFEEKGSEAFERDPVGTGPYMLETVFENPSEGVLLTRNPDYWGEPANMPKLHVQYIADTTARTLALLSGDVHMIEGVRAPGWVPSIKARNSDLHFDTSSPGSFFTIQMNMQKPPFDNQKVRQAVAYLIDRDTIAEAMAPISRRTFGLNPPSFPAGFTEETVPDAVRYDHDPEKAKALLAEAGLPEGFAFDSYTSQREDYQSIALMIQDMLRAGGIEMNLEVKDHTAFHADQATNTNTIFLRSAAYPPVPTQAIGEQLSSAAEVKNDGSGGPNFSHYGVAIPGIDDMLEAAMAEPNLDERIKKVQAIEEKFLTDMPLLPIVTNGYLIVRAPNVDLGYEQQSGYAHWRLTDAAVN